MPTVLAVGGIVLGIIVFLAYRFPFFFLPLSGRRLDID